MRASWATGELLNGNAKVSGKVSTHEYWLRQKHRRSTGNIGLGGHDYALDVAVDSSTQSGVTASQSDAAPREAAPHQQFAIG
jgi:hypothetical protein